jgi:hypothetical protein
VGAVEVVAVQRERREGRRLTDAQMEFTRCVGPACFRAAPIPKTILSRLLTPSPQCALAPR